MPQAHRATHLNLSVDRFHHGLLRVKAVIDSPYCLWIALALPACLWTLEYWTERKFYGEFIHVSGQMSAVLLLWVLSLSPLKVLFPKARWLHWFFSRRRAVGVACFAYAFLHTAIYIERKALGLVIAEATDASMIAGWVALFIIALLAITSNDRCVRLMRNAWRKLHTWVHAASIALFVHWLLSAFDPTLAYYYFAAILLLFIIRIKPKRQI